MSIKSYTKVWRNPGVGSLRYTSDFLHNRMRMTHVYQPVMLRHLLENGGEATAGEIARAVLAEDKSQAEYYERITKRYPGRVLETMA